jgi:hypothetical protein
LVENIVPQGLIIQKLVQFVANMAFQMLNI